MCPWLSKKVSSFSLFSGLQQKSSLWYNDNMHSTLFFSGRGPKSLKVFARSLSSVVLTDNKTSELDMSVKCCRYILLCQAFASIRIQFDLKPLLTSHNFSCSLMVAQLSHQGIKRRRASVWLLRVMTRQTSKGVIEIYIPPRLNCEGQIRE